MAEPIDRRGAVKTLGFASLALALAPAGYAGLKASGAGMPLERWLLSLVGDLDSARHVGRAYLENAPLAAGRDSLLAELFPRLEPATGDRTAAAWRNSFSAACRQDFAQGRTLRVDGWVLSQTEVRLCALATLT
jgi:hypothetical protein